MLRPVLHLSSLNTILKKCTVTKPQVTEPLTDRSWETLCFRLDVIVAASRAGTRAWLLCRAALYPFFSLLPLKPTGFLFVSILRFILSVSYYFPRFVFVGSPPASISVFVRPLNSFIGVVHTVFVHLCHHYLPVLPLLIFLTVVGRDLSIYFSFSSQRDRLPG